MTAALSYQSEAIQPQVRALKVKASGRIDASGFRTKGLELVGETQGWEYYVLPEDAPASRLKNAIVDYTENEKSKTFFDAVEGLAAIGAEDRQGPGVQDFLDGTATQTIVDIHLWPTTTVREAQDRLRPVRALVGNTEVGADEQPRFLLVRARVDRNVLRQLLGLAEVELVRTPPVPYLAPTDWADVDITELDVPAPRSGTVGVVDDAVQIGHSLLSHCEADLKVPSSRAWQPPTDHGTMVAGLAAYGDLEGPLRDGSALPAPVKVIGARVVEARGGVGQARYPTDVPEHLVLEEAIRKLAARGAKVINLSVSDKYPYSGWHVDIRTEKLDALVRELDLVIVCCSGNVVDLPEPDEIHNEHPLHLLSETARVAEPSVAANVVTVGSVARSDQGAYSDGDSPPGLRAVARRGEVSPFSRSGPGFTDQSVKPDVVHFGGNFVTQPLLNSRSLHTDNPGASTVSTCLPGPFGIGNGTSFSAPRVARIAAVVRAEYPDASANLTRALIGSSSVRPSHHLVTRKTPADETNQSLRFAGYGVPDEERAIASAKSRVALTFDGEISVDTTVIHEIPIPRSFALGRADRSITVALAFDPPIRRLRRDYLAGRMKFDLFRSIDLADLENLLVKQDPSTARPMPNDRRRLRDKLRPSMTSIGRSTLQVRTWTAAHQSSLDPEDGPSYYLAVTHTSEPWSDLAEPDYDKQRYGLVVQLEDRTRTEIDLYAQLRADLSAVRVRIGETRD